ncbi:MAG: DNA translocase FtsK 4TM domain-containing protein [Labilithrix sp.]|nr:DNA translocase FtsK 4TM domain-containing protein [Labilithrix sp.]
MFVPRGGRPLPQNTRAPNVLGAQPQTFARGREVAALLLWTLAVFFALALASYAGEPAVAGQTEPPSVTGEDWVGPVGAVVARGAVGLVGVMSWVVPFEALLLGIPFVTGRRSRATAARMAGDILLVVIGASLVQVGWPEKVAFGRHAAGGLVGELFGEIARSLFSTAGSFLVGFALVGLILIGRASFSFIALMRTLARIGRLVVTRFRGATESIAAAWKKARELERTRAEESRKASEPHIALPGDDEAMILGGDPLDDGGEHDIAPEPSAAPPVTRVRVASTEAFPEVSPLVLTEPSPKRSRAAAPLLESVSSNANRLEPGKPKARRKKSEDDASHESGAIEAKLDAEVPASSARKSRRKKAAPPEVSVEEAIEQACGDEDEEDDAEGGGAEESDPVALPVTPLESVEVTRGDAESKKKPRASKPVEAPAGITIVDTSAALEKDAPVAEEPVKKEKAKEKKAKETPAFKLPSLDMLVPAPANIGPVFDEVKLRANAELLVKTLADYKVTGKVEEILPGPVVTTFEVSPVAGTKVSKVAALADDLALALAKKVRIVAPIPGKNRIGFELPNDKRVAVNLRDLVEDRRFQTLDVPLPVVLGRDIVGNPVYADLASMPHAIVAGATGAGKSVGLNVMLTSLLFRRTPEELRMLMIDPKVVELAPFDRIPHMLLPVVTDMKQAATALKWAVDEMERRYQLFADAGTKNIGTYNGWVKRVLAGEIKNPLGKAIVGRDHNNLQEVLSVRFDDPEGEQLLPEVLPMIVIVIDEFADLMMQQGKEVEACVARLAQKARAAGMHVILATQRPSVDVITGMIKANFPTRIAFRVAQKIDSRTILDEQGAEHLLGKGDMLIKLNGTNETRRVQCPWVSEEEVQEVTDFLRAQGEPVYDENILKPRDDEAAAEDDDDGETDPMYDDAVRIVSETRRCSTSWLQRKLGLGYNRAARIVETMERRGLVGPANGAKDREVLIEAI